MIKNRNSLCYELGVMMFNAFDVYSIGNYEIHSNLQSIITALGNIDSRELRDGFYSEAENHGYANQPVDLFQRAVNSFDWE